MERALWILVFLLCLLCAVKFTITDTTECHITYCVRADGHSNCSYDTFVECKECQPLMWFVNHTQTILNNSEMIFQPGVHYLNSTTSERVLMNFTNKNDLKLIGMGRVDMDPIDKTPLPTSRVVCNNEAGFFFQNSSNVEIHGLTFGGCGVNVSIRTSHFSLRAAVFFHTSYNITISEVLIEDSPWFGLHMDNICGDITITNSVFTRSNSGNAVFWFKHCQLIDFVQTTLFIKHTLFSDGHSNQSNGTGLYLLIFRPSVVIKLDQITARNNTGVNGGNIAIKFEDFARNTSNVSITNSNIEYGHAERAGGGLLMWFEKNARNTNDTNNCGSDGLNRFVLFISNTVFQNNSANKSGGAAIIRYYERAGTGCTIREIRLDNCTFIGNTAVTAAALEISKHKVPIYQVHNVPQFTVSIDSCNVSNNRLHWLREQRNKDGIIDIFSVEKVTIRNSSFTQNHGTALLLVNSGVKFKNFNIFEGNNASFGGAIKICDGSVLSLTNHSRILFRENRARVAGGAIYAGDLCLQVTPPCFFQLQPSDNISVITDLSDRILRFVDNSAGVAGMAIYGGSVDNCFTDVAFREDATSEASFYNSLAIYKRIFSFNMPDEVSLITSDPYGICMCHPMTGRPNCTVRDVELGDVYAGQEFNVSVSAVGQMDGAVPAMIFVDNSSLKNFKVHGHVYSHPTTRALCQTIPLAVFSAKVNTYITFKLKVSKSNSVSESSNYFKLPKLKVTVRINPCPLLFQLTKPHNGCDCDSILTKHGVKCDINTFSIQRLDHKIWIGCSGPANLSSNKTSLCERVEVSKGCKEDRCSEVTKLTFTTLDTQCVKGRTGRLCGHCDTNYSLSLGALTCVQNEQCSIWKSLLLVVVFLLAGILFVCFLAIFNFTITEGTVNGLLFYANFIHGNQESFFPNDAGTSNTNFFRIFISWLNLDLGFQVCFYEGMTAYQKFWLEFAFLFYLFFLGSLIVVLSHKFIWFTRLAGRNVVPVLSTIIVFAYPKLIRNSIRVLECEPEKNMPDFVWVWRADETIDCFGPKRYPLTILTVIFYIVALLYTLSLLFIQCLQRRSNWCVLRWVNRLRPFFDANTGPCRDHYRFWPGFLLFARFGLYTVYAGVHNVHNPQNIKLFSLVALCVFMFFLACVSPNGVYKKWPLNLLEFAFFLNLGIVSGVVVSLQNKNQSIATVFTDISVGIAAATFACILLYHSYKRVSGTRKWRRMTLWLKEKHNRRLYDVLQIPTGRGDQDEVTTHREVDERTPLSRARQIPPVFDDRIRESLLADNS